MHLAALLVSVGFALGRADQDLPRAAPVVPRPEPTRQAIDHAILISVDGLRSDALIALPPSELPGFTRLRRGASTLNARTDPDFTITLPNHTAMLTGRAVSGASGHGWTENDEPEPDETLHRNKGRYVAGIFDVAHDRGVRTAMFVGKTKFAIYDTSWNAEHGAPDTTGADEGRDKIDLYRYFETTSKVTDAALELLASDAPKTLGFVHYAVTDQVGHLAGWDVSPKSRYMQAVVAVDREIVRLLDAVEGSEKLRGRTALVLTADHGGGAPFKSHTEIHMWIDYVIPFVVWTGGSTGLDLYAANAGARKDPSLAQPSMDAAGPPPIRNGDAGNVVLALLGLPPVPDSTIGAAQDLRVR